MRQRIRHTYTDKWSIISKRTDNDLVVKRVVPLSTGISSETEQQRFTELEDQLVQQLPTDTLLRDALIAQMQAYPKSLKGQFALDLLSRLDDPQVMQAAIELAGSSNRDIVLAGVDLLGQINIGNEQTLAVSEQLIQDYRDDADVLLGALRSLPTISTDTETTGRIVRTLSELTQHGDAAVRSASTFGVVRWADNAEALTAVVNQLDSADPDDRISAAMALEQTSLVSDEILEKLLYHMNDAEQLWEVRRMAADALGRYSLTAEQNELLRNFREEQRMSLPGVVKSLALK